MDYEEALDYEDALKAAGATVMAFERFGSCEGDWFAKVEFNGKVGYVHGAFGSCSGCDAFEAEIGILPDSCEQHSQYESREKRKDCIACREIQATAQAKVVEFGLGYLDEILTQEQAEALAAKDVEWDLDAVKMLRWIQSLK